MRGFEADRVRQVAHHNFFYGDPKRVRAARVQAEGRIAFRQLWHLLVDSWAVPVLEWLSRRLPK